MRLTPVSVLLLPLAAVYRLAVGLRRLAYLRGWIASFTVPVPVWIVGNITAGGSGKTPMVIWLVHWLIQQGLRPGVISRGYGGHAQGCVEVPQSPGLGILPDTVALKPYLREVEIRVSSKGVFRSSTFD